MAKNPAHPKPERHPSDNGAQDTAQAAAETGEPLAQHEAVLRKFRGVFNAVKTHFQQVERRSGVGGSQVWALSTIRAKPGIGVNQLATVLNVRQPTASIIVKALTQQALVEARRDGVDRRSVQLHITAAGRKVLTQAPFPHEGVLPRALQALDPTVLDMLDQGLSALMAELDADPDDATIPLADLESRKVQQ